MKNFLKKCALLCMCFILPYVFHPVVASQAFKEVNQQPISLTYLTIYVKEKGKKNKAYKTSEIKGSKSKIQREVKAYIQKYVPKSSTAQCKIVLVQNTMNKNYSGAERNKSVSGDGMSIQKNISSVMRRLM